MTRFRLTVLEDGRRSDVFLDRTRVTIGRALGNDVRLRDPRSSRRHCRVEPSEGGWILVDEESQNGTLLNGRRVARSPLSPGDVIRIGSASIAFAPDESTGASSPLEAGRAAASTSHETESRERDNLLALQRINRALNTQTELRALLTLIVDSAIELTGAERGFLILEETGKPEGGGEPALRYEVARNFARETGEMPPERFLARIAAPVRETGRPLFVVDASEDERFRDALSIEEMRLRSVLAVPLAVLGGPGGVLAVDHRLQAGAFSEDDLDLLDALAQQAAIAIANARLIAELRATTARVEALNARLARRVEAQEEELDHVRAELGAARGSTFAYHGIVGRGRAMREVFRRLDRIVPSEFPVLVQGESGTGKELFARAIHENGPRRSTGRFVAESCAALPDNLLASELFGHVKGAFTGADRARKGLFEHADGGTLFLDEVGEMSVEMQKKLLRVLEEGVVRPVGADRAAKVDVRIIAASNRDLSDLVRKGEFREDLYYRLNVLPLRLPPLRERVDDLAALVDHFLGLAAGESGSPKKRVRPGVFEVLARYPWPGNVRELEHEVRKWIVFAGEEIGPDAISPEIREGLVLRPGAPEEDGRLSLPDRVRSLEVRAIRDALALHGGNKTAAAQALGVSRFALQRKMAKHGIEDSEGAA